MPPSSLGPPPPSSMGMGGMSPSSMGMGGMPPSSMAGMPPSSIGGSQPSASMGGMPPRPSVGAPPGMGHSPRPGMGMPPQPGMGMPPQPGMGMPQQPGMGMPPQPGMGGQPGGGYSSGGYPGAMNQPQRKALDPDSMPNPIQVMADDKAAHNTGEFTTNEKGKVPPLVTTHFLTRDQGNSGPRMMRSTMYSVPDNPDMT